MVAKVAEVKEGEFTLGGCVGRGSFGDVYSATRPGDPKKYVVKKVKLARQSDWQREATRRELKLMSMLSHPFIVRYVESWTHHGHTVVVVYEFCEQGDLAAYSHKRKGKPIEEETLKLWLAQLLLGLDYLKENGVLHRDIKASNIFLTAQGAVQIGDFGLASVVSAPQDADASHDQSLVGTPHYMSPELLGQKTYGYKTDIWSLGCVMYELTAGRPAFDAFNLAGLVKKIQKNATAPLPSGFSDDWCSVIRSMLRKDPATRPSARDLLACPILQPAVAAARALAQQLMPNVYLPPEPEQPYTLPVATPPTTPLKRGGADESNQSEPMDITPPPAVVAAAAAAAARGAARDDGGSSSACPSPDVAAPGSNLTDQHTPRGAGAPAGMDVDGETPAPLWSATSRAFALATPATCGASVHGPAATAAATATAGAARLKSPVGTAPAPACSLMDAMDAEAGAAGKDDDSGSAAAAAAAPAAAAAASAGQAHTAKGPRAAAGAVAAKRPATASAAGLRTQQQHAGNTKPTTAAVPAKRPASAAPTATATGSKKTAAAPGTAVAAAAGTDAVCSTAPAAAGTAAAAAPVAAGGRAAALPAWRPGGPKAARPSSAVTAGTTAAAKLVATTSFRKLRQALSSKTGLKEKEEQPQAQGTDAGVAETAGEAAGEHTEKQQQQTRRPVSASASPRVASAGSAAAKQHLLQQQTKPAAPAAATAEKQHQAQAAASAPKPTGGLQAKPQQTQPKQVAVQAAAAPAPHVAPPARGGSSQPHQLPPRPQRRTSNAGSDAAPAPSLELHHKATAAAGTASHHTVRAVRTRSHSLGGSVRTVAGTAAQHRRASHDSLLAAAAAGGAAAGPELSMLPEHEALCAEHLAAGSSLGASPIRGSAGGLLRGGSGSPYRVSNGLGAADDTTSELSMPMTGGAAEGDEAISGQQRRMMVVNELFRSTPRRTQDTDMSGASSRAASIGGACAQGQGHSRSSSAGAYAYAGLDVPAAQADAAAAVELPAIGTWAHAAAVAAAEAQTVGAPAVAAAQLLGTKGSLGNRSEPESMWGSEVVLPVLSHSVVDTISVSSPQRIATMGSASGSADVRSLNPQHGEAGAREDDDPALIASKRSAEVADTLGRYSVTSLADLVATSMSLDDGSASNAAPNDEASLQQNGSADGMAAAAATGRRSGRIPAVVEHTAPALASVADKAVAVASPGDSPCARMAAAGMAAEGGVVQAGVRSCGESPSGSFGGFAAQQGVVAQAAGQYDAESPATPAGVGRVPSAAAAAAGDQQSPLSMWLTAVVDAAPLVQSHASGKRGSGDGGAAAASGGKGGAHAASPASSNMGLVEAAEAVLAAAAPLDRAERLRLEHLEAVVAEALQLHVQGRMQELGELLAAAAQC